MKLFVYIIFFAVIFFACEKGLPPIVEAEIKAEQKQKDLDVKYIEIIEPVKCDRTADSLKIDSLIHVTRNLQDSLFLRKAQIANCKKYLRICIKNPSQDQFLKGWIRRALDL